MCPSLDWAVGLAFAPPICDAPMTFPSLQCEDCFCIYIFNKKQWSKILCAEILFLSVCIKQFQEHKQSTAS